MGINLILQSLQLFRRFVLFRLLQVCDIGFQSPDRLTEFLVEIIQLGKTGFLRQSNVKLLLPHLLHIVHQTLDGGRIPPAPYHRNQNDTQRSSKDNRQGKIAEGTDIPLVVFDRYHINQRPVIIGERINHDLAVLLRFKGTIEQPFPRAGNYLSLFVQKHGGTSVIDHRLITPAYPFL